MKKEHFNGEITVYVPVYKQLDTEKFPHYPTYVFSYGEASTDEQLVASMGPDKILVLKGEYNWEKPE